MGKLFKRVFMMLTALVGCDAAEMEMSGVPNGTNGVNTADDASGAGVSGAAGGAISIGNAPPAGHSAVAEASGRPPAAAGGAGGEVLATAGVGGAAGVDAAATGGNAASPGPANGGGGTGGATTQDPVVTTWPALDAAQFGEPKLISDAFKLAEGPVWDHCQQRLLFTDVNNRRIHTFKPGGEVGVYLEPTNWTNGLIFDFDGSLLMAEMGNGRGGRVTRLRRDMQIEVLADKSPSGRALQTTDDLTLRSDGTIYFSDPIITHGDYSNDLGSLTTHPFYRLKPSVGGAPREVVAAGTATLPNGIRLSPDEKTLYVAGFIDDRVVKYDVAEDGSLGEPKTFATGLDGADSMCLDAAGNLYVAVKRGLQVIRADGTKLKLLRVDSSDGTTNCSFGGPDGKTLFITAWKLFLQLEGVPIPGLDWQLNKRIEC
jgi:gluconolactonase